MRHPAWLAGVLIVAVVSTARAVTLDSPPLANSTGTQLVCRVVNVGTKEAIVTARLLNVTSGASIGTVVFPNCNAEIPLQPVRPAPCR